MIRKARKLRPAGGSLQQRKLFLVAVEGLVTENDYFALLGDYANIDIKCLYGRQSAPKQVLERMQMALAKKDIRSTDEACLERLPYLVNYRVRLLPVAAIYRGNSSGKTIYNNAINAAGISQSACGASPNPAGYGERYAP